MAEENLKDKTAKGLLWGGLSNGVQQLLNLFFGIFLARILNSEDYGMVGMLSIFSLIAGSLQESGFTAALANKREITHKDYNAVFWFSTFLSAFLYIILFFCAPLIADFYEKPELTALARYSFLGFFIASLGIAQNAYLFRNLMVKQKSISLIIALIISGCIGVFMAYNGFAYWGIATQSIVYVATIDICYWYFSKWRPTLSFDFSPLKGMISFSSKLLVTNIFNHINNNILTVILGKFFTEKTVGYFTQANKWNYMGHSLVSGMVNSVAQPVLLSVSDDRDRQLRVFRKMLRFTAFVAFPAMLGLSLVAPELIVITIKAKWLPSVTILQILCIGASFIPITNLYSNLIISKGKSNIYMWNTIALGLLQIIMMTCLHSYGINVMLSIYVTINILWLLIWHYFVWKEIKISFFMALKDISFFAAAAIFTMMVTYFVTESIGNMYLLIASKIIIAAILYIFIMWISRSVTFRESINYIFKRK